MVRAVENASPRSAGRGVRPAAPWHAPQRPDPCPGTAQRQPPAHHVSSMPIPQAPSRATAPPAAPRAPVAPAKPAEVFDPVAAFLAYLFPGAGHFYLGQRARAVCIAAGVLSLFMGGLLIGGIDVIDRKDNTIWFVGQALTGPIAFGMDAAHQSMKVVGPTKQLDGRVVDTLRDPYPGEVRDPAGHAAPAPNSAPAPLGHALGRMNELGTLFATIAGMLNLIVIIDAAFHTRVSPLRALGLQTTFADAERRRGGPQTIDASLKPGARP